MWANREQVEARLHALIADFLDSREDSDRELDLGVIAFVVEVKERRTPEEIEDLLAQRTRPEAVYTPEAEWTQSMWYRCSDAREWVASALFRQAMLIADGEYDEGEATDEPERPE